MQAGTFKFIENWKFIRINNITKQILDTEEFCNTIVNDGLERVARLIMGDSSTYFRALAIGEGATAVTNSDTELESEIDRALATLSYVTSYKAKFAKTFTFGSSYSITEAGIFDSTSVSGSTMLARVVTTAKEVDADIDLIVEATITVSRV